MALLSAEERLSTWRMFMEQLSDAREPLGAVTKEDLRLAVNAVDAWVEANQASFNSAIPQPARTQLSTPQKARLLMYVITRRFATGA